MEKGRLVIVGTGILTPAHLSQESINRIQTADIVHVLVPDPLGLSTIEKLNNNVRNLAELYFDTKSDRNGKNRLDAYNLMVESILADVRKGLSVCAIFYGHPGVFVYPSHVSIARAREEGFEAKMLPAISAEDCLFADLSIDPGDNGCQVYEASQLMFFKHTVNIHAPLILWQIGVVGDASLTKLEPHKNGLKMLLDCLQKWYPVTHEAMLYEANALPIIPPRIDKICLSKLPLVKVSTVTTLFIPQVSEPDVNRQFCNKWNIDINLLG